MVPLPTQLEGLGLAAYVRVCLCVHVYIKEISLVLLLGHFSWLAVGKSVGKPLHLLWIRDARLTSNRLLMAMVTVTILALTSRLSQVISLSMLGNVKSQAYYVQCVGVLTSLKRVPTLMSNLCIRACVTIRAIMRTSFCKVFEIFDTYIFAIFLLSQVIYFFLLSQCLLLLSCVHRQNEHILRFKCYYQCF